MMKFVIAGTLVTALAVGVPALAQSTAAKQPAAGAAKQAPKAAAGAEKAADQAEKPAAKKKASSSGDTGAAGHTAPKTQPPTTDAPTIPPPVALGSVHIPKGLKANGQELPAGTYQLRLTTEAAKPDARGATEGLERWMEFMQGGKVVGREIATIIPKTETHLVAKDTAPPAGGVRVDALKGGEFTRVWVNRAGTYYLVHLTHMA